MPVAAGRARGAFNAVATGPGSAPDRGRSIEFRNDTAINVVGLLKAAFGDGRVYPLSLERFPLDDGLVAEEVVGDVRLTRLRDAIMARVDAEGTVELECVRCLRAYARPFTVSFSEEFRQSVDVRTGIGLLPGDDEDEETARIDENHELDLGDVLRQEILVALPMRPDCGDLCPGPEALGGAAAAAFEEPSDDRFAALADLLIKETPRPAND